MKVVIKQRHSSSLSASSGLRFSHVGGISSARDHHTSRAGSGLVEVDLSVAEGAVLEAQLVQLGEEGLVLASLTSVVVLQEDALTRSDAGGEVTTTVTAVDVVIIYLSVAAALGAVELLLRHINRRSSGEKLDG